MNAEAGNYAHRPCDEWRPSPMSAGSFKKLEEQRLMHVSGVHQSGSVPFKDPDLSGNLPAIPPKQNLDLYTRWLFPENP
jgi:hypothetical protein